MRRFLIAATLVLAIPTSAFAQGRPAAVGVQELATQLMSETVPVFAEIVTARDGAVASRVAGSVDSVNVLAGNNVERGDVLVELNRDLLEIRRSQAKAQIAEAEASVETGRVRVDSALTAFNRIEALRGSTSFSQGRFDDAQANVQVARTQLVEAQARLETGRARLEEAEYQLTQSRVRAPFAGVVIGVETIPGAFIQAGTPVVRLLDTQSFEVEASVPARYVADLRPDQTMQGAFETGASVSLVLRAILPVESATTRTRAVRFAGQGLQGLPNIAVGQSLTVDVPVGAAREVLTVPKDALVQARGGWTVFVANEGKAEPRTVLIGAPSGDRYEVLAGLAPGDQVVVRGNERLRPGQDINPTEIN
ncbi:MAG: efflux RND transporter periplasmic adaptor subunit [Pseudomonadota bacterium]